MPIRPHFIATVAAWVLSTEITVEWGVGVAVGSGALDAAIDWAFGD